jgi:hypothetical protein
MDLRGIEWDNMDIHSSGLGWELVEGTCEHGNEISGSIKFWEFLEYVSE